MFRVISTIISCLFLSACAGPTTPFGAISSLVPDARSEAVKNSDQTPQHNPLANPQIKFFPKRQQLHQSKNLKIQLNDVYSKQPEKYLSIYYNGIDVTKKALKTARKIKTMDGYEFEVPKLKFPANRYNDIKVSYIEPGGASLHATYHPPSCQVFEQNSISNTEPFSPPPYYLELINSFAPRASINPSLVAGIIAQESGFNPKAVSWAKAIGLTQVTPIAEKQIIEDVLHYPRYPKLNEFNYVRIKAMIHSGKIDESKEWRLNPSYSIQGGIIFLKYIDSYWRKPNNAEILKGLPGDPQIVYSQVLLASYNSGPARVKYAIERKGASWLRDKKLTEARKYVNRIFSYCYHFSEGKEIKEYADAS